MEFLLALGLGGGWLFSSLLFNGEGEGGGTFLGVEALVGLKGGSGSIEETGVWSWSLRS